MKSVVVLGDSISRGIVLTGAHYSILEYGCAEQCAQALPITIANYSKMGCTVERGVQILEQRSAAVAYADYTVIEFGGNDSDFYWEEIAENPSKAHTPKTGIAQFRATYERMIQRVRELGSQPIMLSLPLLDSQRYFDFLTRHMSIVEKENILQWLGGQVERIRNYHDLYNLEVLRIAAEQKVPLIDITKPFLEHTINYQQYICADGVHPNQAGHDLIAARLIAFARSQRKHIA